MDTRLFPKRLADPHASIRAVDTCFFAVSHDEVDTKAGRYSLLAFGMEVNPTHSTLDLIETDIIEAFKAGSLDALQLVVRHKEMLLPPHENVFLLPPIFVVEGIHEIDVALRLKTERPPWREPRPVSEISLITSSPTRVSSSEAVFLIWSADDLAGEESRQCRVVRGEPTNLQVARHGRLFDIHGQYSHFDVVDLPV